ncbi:MAG: CRTAC1 family protein, partial [Bacteroidota bacterium]
SRLYLNQGNLRFQDITQAAGVSTHRWITGIAVADINADGWDDMYVSVSGHAEANGRKNLLFINQQDNTFSEEAESYGLADTSQCTHANFFDYDKDGDLDLFVIVNPTDYQLYNVNSIRSRKLNGQARSTDKLYRNNRISTQKDIQEAFTDVSREAGILIEGYSLSLNVSDLNQDGWPDVYITNDFLTNDILYINNQDGSFTDRSAEMLKHTSFASMGLDVADVNNDGLPEIYVLDMFPEDNFREKMIMGSENYDRFQYILKAGYQPQYSRNTLQKNNGDGTFSEIGQLANVHRTDWSWSALLADYDNDGWRDLFVTNGFRRDLGSLDYIKYANTDPFGSPESRKAKQLERIKEQPGAKLSNYIFRNQNGWQFEKKSRQWGIDEASYSHGAAYADLDRDGDLDLIINNVSQEAFLYENQSEKLSGHHFLQIQLPPDQFGTRIRLTDHGEQQFVEHTPYHGYQSSTDALIHFGLGEKTKVERIEIEWPDGGRQLMTQVAADQILVIEKSPTNGSWTAAPTGFTDQQFAERKDLIEDIHQEDPQLDFRVQALLPHQHSLQGPPLATGDVNGDGYEDVFVGGSAGFLGHFWMQQGSGEFMRMDLIGGAASEDTDAQLFDADGDGDLDLYVVSGGVIMSLQDSLYQDRLYINENGRFTLRKELLPEMRSSGSVVKAHDMDADGDLDVFVGGRVVPKSYPSTPRSYLLENVEGKFVDQTPAHLQKPGMVSDAIWTDYDDDGDNDLMLVGEFMSIRIFPNQNGQLTESITLPGSGGWWNCVEQADLDGDGDVDYLVGNIGLNTDLRASIDEPIHLYTNDFDQNGTRDPILCQYRDGKEFPLATRDELMRQIPPIKVRFSDYQSYAKASFNDLFKGPEKKGMTMLTAQELRSCWIESLGQGQLRMHPLPIELQMAPIQDFCVLASDAEAPKEILVVGNSYATEVGIGAYDAFQGALVQFNGQRIRIKSSLETGFRADQDARRIVKLKDIFGNPLWLISNNQGALQSFVSHAGPAQFTSHGE